MRRRFLERLVLGSRRPLAPEHCDCERTLEDSKDQVEHGAVILQTPCNLGAEN